MSGKIKEKDVIVKINGVDMKLAPPNFVLSTLQSVEVRTGHLSFRCLSSMVSALVSCLLFRSQRPLISASIGCGNVLSAAVLLIINLFPVLIPCHRET